MMFLLEKGADPNYRDKDGDTAIHSLLRQKSGGETRSRALREVIKAGGNVYSRTSDGHTPSELAKWYNHWTEWERALQECGIEQVEIDRMESEAISALQDRNRVEEDSKDDNDDNDEEEEEETDDEEHNIEDEDSS